MNNKKATLINSGMLLLAVVLPLVFLTATRDTFLVKQTLLSTIIPLILIIITIKRIPLFKTNLLYPSAVFAAVILLSLLNTKNITVSLMALYDKLVFLAVYFIIAGQNNKEFRSRFINGSLIAGFLVCLYGIMQSLGIDFVTWGRAFGGRMSSSLGNPNFLAGYLVALIPVSLASAIQTKNKPGKILLFMNTALLALCLVLTKTRGSWLSFSASMLVFLVLAAVILKKAGKTRQLKRLYAACAITIVLLASFIALANNSYTRKFKSIFNPNIASVYERVFKWRTAKEMINDHPLLGVGIGAVKVNYALYQAKARTRQNIHIKLKGTSESQVHNEYMQIWAEAGILGLLSFAGILIVFFISVFRRKNKDNKQEWLRAGLITAVAGILFDGVSNFPLHIIPTGFLFWSYLGLLEDNKEPVPDKPAPIKPVQLIYKTVIILVIAAAWLKTAPGEFSADIHRSNGDLANNAKNWQTAIAEYEQAHKLSPTNGRICYDLGMAYVKLKDYDSAIRVFGESIKIRNYGEVYNDLANAYYLKKQYRDAIDNWEVAVRLGLPDSDDHDRVVKNLNILKAKMKE